MTSHTLAKDVVTVECTIERETEKALLITCFNIESQKVSVWIPLSQVEEIHHTEPAVLVIKRWIAREKGLAD